MSEISEAAVLADLAQLKLEQGDAEGAERLFRQALEQGQQQAGVAAAEAGGSKEDEWEAWDEDNVPLPVAASAAAQKPPAVDSWESAAPAVPARRSERGGGVPSSSIASVSPARAAPAGAGSSDGEEQEPLQFGGGHVLEFYDLTSAVLTQHLEAFIERYARGHAAPPVLKWVDDCHAAVVCSDPAAARQLLAAATARGGAAEYKLRGYADAGSGARKLPGSELLPPKPRPKTSAAVARRLIGGALNMKLRDRDAEQKLRAARQQQQQQRQERQKALDSTWDD